MNIKLTWFERFIWYPIYRFCNNIYMIPKWIKWFLQRIFRGYSDCDLWGLDEHLSKVIVKRLIAFKKMKRIGYPSPYPPPLKKSKVNHRKEWEKKLDKMIWAFKNYGEDDYCFKDIGETVWKDLPNGRCQLVKSGIKTNEKKLNKHWDKTKEGLDIFADSFGNLWD